MRAEKGRERHREEKVTKIAAPQVRGKRVHLPSEGEAIARAVEERRAT